jgi:hypothetical protein
VLAVNEWLIEHPEPVFYNGKDMTVGVTTKTGYSLIGDDQ